MRRLTINNNGKAFNRYQLKKRKHAKQALQMLLYDVY